MCYLELTARTGVIIGVSRSLFLSNERLRDELNARVKEWLPH